MTGSRVDAVVVTYRSAELLPECLAALRCDPNIDTITVIDHGDDHCDLTAVELGADRVVLDPSNPGFGAGQNRGVGLGGNPYLLLCNPDARIRPDAVSRGVAVLDTDPGLAAVQGVISNPGTGLIDRSAGSELGPIHLWGRALALRRVATWGPITRLLRYTPIADSVHRVPDHAIEVEALAATAPLIRRRAFESVGGFDTSYFLYGEDLDLCRRLRGAGWRLLALPDQWADHREGASSPEADSRERVWWGGTMSFAARWWSRPAWFAALMAAAVAAVRHGHGNRAATRANWEGMITRPVATRRLYNR